MAKSKKPEAKLRKEIINILKSQGKKVVDNCSPVEFGADVLFIDQNYFGIDEMCAIQIKVGDLGSREGRPSKSVKELLGQALIGITKERIDGNAKYKVSKFYIVVDGTVKPFVKMYTDQINYHFKQIQIIEKDDLRNSGGHHVSIQPAFLPSPTTKMAFYFEFSTLHFELSPPATRAQSLNSHDIFCRNPSKGNILL